MSVLMPSEKNWLVSNWISHGFFEDCLPHLNKAPQLEADIQFCVDAEVDTLDLRDRDIQTIQELKVLVSLVLEDNILSKGRNFHSPKDFPVYLDKIEALNALLGEILKPSSTS